MPIELRPSDVAEQAAQAFGKWGDVFGQIFANEYEKERVREVNSALVTLEKHWQQQTENYPTRGFTVPRDPEKTGGPPMDTTLSLGELQASDVLEDFAKSQNAQREFIERTVRNKKAREEMLAHLAAGGVEQQGRLLGKWKQAAQAHEKATLQVLTQATLQREGWNADRKMEAIGSQVLQMLQNGMIQEDEADVFMESTRQTAVALDAYNGAVEAMVRDQSFLKAQEFLAVFEPYKGDPAAREKVLDVVRAKWDEMVKANNAQKESGYANEYTKMTTYQEAEEQVKALAKDTFWGDDRGDIKVKWVERFRVKADALAREAAGGGSDKAWKQAYEDRMWYAVLAAKRDGKPFGEIQKMVLDGMYRKDPNGIPVAVYSGENAKSMMEYVGAKENYALTNGINVIEDKIKGLKNPVEQARALNAFRQWYQYHPSATQKDIQDAAENIVGPIVQENLNAFARETWATLWSDKRTLDPYEVLMGQIQARKYVGLAEDRRAYLTGYNAALRTRVTEDPKYSGLGIDSAMTDFIGEYSEPGTCIFSNPNKEVFAYRLVGKTMILFQLKKNGWQIVTPAAPAKAAPLPVEPLPASTEALYEQARRSAANIPGMPRATAPAPQLPLGGH